MLQVKALVILVGAAALVLSSSHRPPPLHARGLSYPIGVAVTLIPRRADAPLRARAYADPAQPAWDDSFLLEFATHDLPPVTLSLRPSTTLLHPRGIKEVHTHTDANGERSTTTRWIQRETVRAYEGWVVDHASQDDSVRQRWIKEEIAGVRRVSSPSNWARIVLHDSAESPTAEGPTFAGAFAVDGELFTILPTATYLRTKDAVDPAPPLLQKRNAWGTSSVHPPMVVVRERDVLSPLEHIAELRKRGQHLPAAEVAAAYAASTAHSCGHDDLPFNVDPAHPVYEHAHDHAVFSELSAFSPWLTTVFGLPARSPPPSSFARKEISSDPYPYPPRLHRRQSDAAGSGNASSNFINSIGSSAGCPKSSMVLFMGVAADCTFTAQFASIDLARTAVLTDFNSASSLYSSTFNISLGIVELNVQSGTCPTTTAEVDSANPWNVGCEEGGGPGLDLNDRLSVFSAWRGAKGGGDGAGLWHLLTNCSTGSEVGVAWLGQLCRVSASSSNTGSSTSGTGVTSITRSIWQVISHEIGHSFGAIHDCASGCSLVNSNPVCCPLTTTTCDAQANYIMSPVSTKNVSAFSQCSLGNICTSLTTSLNTTCLAVPGDASNPSLISLKSCGNGILEAGEDCDPGSNTDDACCDAATCKFAAGAVCDPLNSLCCTSTCQIASSGTVCRASVDPNCDREEVCQGTSATCPADVFVSDGTSCGSDGLACASGICTSRSLQCQTAGSSLGLTAACPTRASDSCSISCQDPSSSADCIVLEQSFRDGTPCGYAGTCENNECIAGSALAVAKSWYRQNLQIAIPVTIVAAIIVLLLIASLYRCCVRKRRNAANAKLAPSARFATSAPIVKSGRTFGRGSRRSRGANLSVDRPEVVGRSSGANSVASQSQQPFFPPPVVARDGNAMRWSGGQQQTSYPPQYPPQSEHLPQPPPQGYGGGLYDNQQWVEPSGWNNQHATRDSGGWR